MSGYKHGGWVKDRKLYGVWAGMLASSVIVHSPTVIEAEGEEHEVRD